MVVVINKEPGTMARMAQYKVLAHDPDAAVREARRQGILGLFPNPSDAHTATRHFGGTAAAFIQGTKALLLRNRHETGRILP